MLDGPVFGYVGFEIILGIILDVILELKSHCESLWAPWVVILAFFWRVGKMILKQAQRKIPGAACRGSCRPWTLLNETDRPTGPEKHLIGAQGHSGGLIWEKVRPHAARTWTFAMLLPKVRTLRRNIINQSVTILFQSFLCHLSCLFIHATQTNNRILIVIDSIHRHNHIDK